MVKKLFFTTKALCLIACAILVLGMIFNVKYVAFADEGDSQDEERRVVYISTLGELLNYTFTFEKDTDDWLNKTYNNYTLVLTQDINMAADTSWHKYAPDWEKYGWPARDMFASLDGAGHTIYNFGSLPLNQADKFDEYGRERCAGLFGFLTGNVSNLNIIYDKNKTAAPGEDVWKDYFGDYGGLAAEAHNAIVSNVHIEGDVVAASTAGGIIGWAVACEFRNCSFTGSLDGIEVGGITSDAADSNIISGCVFKGKLKGAGIGAISGRHNLSTDSMDSKIEVVYDSNIAIIDGIEVLDMGIYREDFYTVGSLVGLMNVDEIPFFTFSDNYVYIDESVTDSVWDIVGQKCEQGAGVIIIGGPTHEVALSPEQLTHIKDEESLEEPNAFKALDFDEEFEINDANGYPTTKRNHVSVIDLTDEVHKNAYQLSVGARYYSTGESAELKVDILDDSYQWVCFMVDGKDMLSADDISEMQFDMGTCHTVVVKAAPLGEIKLSGFNGVKEFKINGKEIVLADGCGSVKYRLGDVIEIEFAMEDGYEMKCLMPGGDGVLSEQDGKYFFTFPKKSVQTSDLDVTLAMKSTEIPPAAPDDDNTVVIAVTVSVGGVLLAALLTYAIVRYKRKHD